MKEINIICEDFFPSRTAPANRASSIVSSLSRYFVVNVFYLSGEECTASSHDIKGLLGDFSENVNFFPIKPVPYKDKNAIGRLWAEALNAIRLLKQSHLKCSSATIVSIPFMMLLPIAALYSLKGQSKYILEVRDLIWEYMEYKGGLFHKIASWLMKAVCVSSLRCFHNTVVVTEGQKKAVEKYSKSIHLIGNGLDRRSYEALSKVSQVGCDLTVLYAGTVGYPQNLSILIDAARMLNEEGSSVSFVVCGSGRELEELKENAPSNVRFLGRLSFESLIFEYSKASILYSQLRDIPSLQTAEPTKTIEYASTGKNMLFGYKGNAFDVASRFENVKCIEPDDANALKNAIREIEHNIDFRLSEKNRLIVRDNYIREEQIASYVQLAFLVVGEDPEALGVC